MTATDTYLLLRAFCDELARCGLEHACTSPGSRSTPIVLSLAREPRIRCFSHLDERCAAFFALGAAKASGRPVALACTSGTAAANFLPAVIEARWARVPLIVLTADRPPELRDVGAGQTIDQIKLYGDAVKWFFELDVQGAQPEQLRWIRTLACRAYWTALEGPPGPVHLNIPLREPLVLEEPLPADEPGGGGRSGRRPWVARPPVPAAADVPDDLTPLPRRGVIVAGRDEGDSGLGRALDEFSRRVGYPVLADPLSSARGSGVIAHYDLLLREPDRLGGLARPDLVLRIGDLPTSKPLRSWLAGLTDARQVALDPDGTWHDPAGVVCERLSVDPASTLAGLAGPSPEPHEAWLDRWRLAEAMVSDVLIEQLRHGLSEPAVAFWLPGWLRPEDTLFVASSMPIRDVETFMNGGPSRVLSNRGANGIDGTVSCAYGVAAASAGRVVLLIGDVALAHDIGGLMAARRTGLPLTIVLINNDGGGIFHFLPVSGEKDAFEEHVATPHGLDFELAARLYGCAYERAQDTPGLMGAVQASFERVGTTIIEVRTDREENLALHRKLAAASLAALESLQAADK